MKNPLRKKGILLLGLGSPSEPSARAVKKFLREFLGDGRVVALPKILRTALVELVILPFRAKKSAARYAKIWTPAGSPFTANSEKLRARVAALAGANVSVRLAMRYGEPSVARALREFSEEGISEIAVLPQFPHYAESSYETAVVHFEKIRARVAPQISAQISRPFFDAPGFIAALATSVARAHVSESATLVVSFHGIPAKSILRTANASVNCDPARENFSAEKCEFCAAREKCYRRQCYATATALAEKIAFPQTRIRVAFQSRFGRGKWLSPATSETLAALSRERARDVFVLAPGFTADCIETLDELSVPGATLIPCLNDSPEFAEFLLALANQTLLAFSHATAENLRHEK